MIASSCINDRPSFTLLTCSAICSLSTLLGIYYTYFFTYCSSVAVAYPLRGLAHCVFRDALLYTTVILCGYLHYCHLPVSVDQSGPSPLISLIHNAFLSTELLMFICFSHHSLQTLKNVVHENPSRSAVSEILKPPCLGPIIIPRSKLL